MQLPRLLLLITCVLCASVPAQPAHDTAHDGCFLEGLARISSRGSGSLEVARGEAEAGGRIGAVGPIDAKVQQIVEPAKEARNSRKRSFFKSKTGAIVLVIAGTLIAGTLARHSIQD
jgi:hypothetical protein